MGLEQGIDDKIQRRIELWKGKLLDISLKNRLINFKESASSIRIDVPDAREFYDQLVNKGALFKFPKDSASAGIKSMLSVPLPEGEAYRKLYKIYLSSRESIAEQVVNTLYIAFGILEHEDRDSGEKLKSPIILIPVQIQRRKDLSKQFHPFTLSFLEDDIFINPALRQRVMLHYGYDIGDSFDDVNEYLRKLEIDTEKFGWKIRRSDMHLGIFSFQKLSLYNDLIVNEELVLRNPVIRTMVGDKAALESVSNVDTDYDADSIDPKDAFFVLDADESQKEAILAARKGASFVLQGPPGTGKSQTIANIIAQLLADGKKVLFVSEKMAALEVVKKRLDSAGIGHYVLEMHNANTAGKRWILEQLENSLVENKLYGSKDELIDQMVESRKVLVEYGKELLSGSSDAFPLCKVFGRLAKLNHIRFAGINVNLSVDFDEFRKNKTIFEELDMYEDQLAQFNSSMLRYINHKWIDVFTDLKKEQLRELLDRCLELIEYIKEDAKNLSNNANIHFRSVSDLKGLDEVLNPLLSIPDTDYALKEHWFSVDCNRFEDAVKEYKIKLDEYNAIHQYLESKYKPEFLNMDNNEFEKMHRKINGSWFFVVRLLDPRYKFYAAKLKSLLKSSSDLEYSELSHDLRQFALFRKIGRDLQKLKGEICDAIDDEKVEADQILSIINWIRNLKKVEGLFNKELINSISSGYDLKGLAERFNQHISDFLDSYFKVMEYFEHEAVERFFKSASWEKLDERFKSIRNHLDDISKWVEFKTALDRLDKNMYRIFAKSMQDEERNYKISELYEKIFLQTYLSRLNLNFAKRSREYFDLVKDKFVKGDDEHKYYSRNRIIKMIESKKPKINLTSTTSEVGILRKEIGKSRRFKPLRRLFSEIRNLIFVLSPCFMMSPLSVARFIDPKVLHFDTVIFDEASQIMVEDAISSIIRADQVIVGGDSKQLPPTMFFKVNEDVDVEEGIEEAASILDETTAALPNHMLRWHYRSRDESLIAFSNRHFYSNSLITFPNNKLNSFAIKLVHVKDGVYDRGGTRQNKIEAQKVVQLVKKHFDEMPGKSLGVIAFSIAQQQAIYDELDRFLRENPSYLKHMNGDSLRAFFVKNLETVQGDERDHIILSVGYGKDADGNLSLNFGPMNKEGGVKRLNVAVTRAIQRITIVSSILPDEIDESRSSSNGLKLLKKYLEYARLSKPISCDESSETNYSDMRDAVYAKLLQEGFDVRKGVGSSKFNIDVAIVDPSNPNEFALGIELDSTAYTNSHSVSDRERIRTEMLRKMGWNVHRIWSYDWVLNYAKEVERIHSLINGSDKLKASSREREGHRRIEHLSKDISFAIKDYPVVAQTSYGTVDQFMKYDFFKHVKEIVKSESPIHKQLVMKRIFDGFGVKGSKKSKARFEEIIQMHLPNNELALDDHDVFWHGDPKFAYNIRKCSLDVRPLNMIPISEIRFAVLLVVDNAISISRKDIPKEVGNIFGAAKITPKFKAKVNLAIDDLFNKKYILTNDDGKIAINKDFGK